MEEDIAWCYQSDIAPVISTYGSDSKERYQELSKELQRKALGLCGPDLWLRQSNDAFSKGETFAHMLEQHLKKASEQAEPSHLKWVCSSFAGDTQAEEQRLESRTGRLNQARFLLRNYNTSLMATPNNPNYQFASSIASRLNFDVDPVTMNDTLRKFQDCKHGSRKQHSGHRR